jgi:hypothetical protein
MLIGGGWNYWSTTAVDQFAVQHFRQRDADLPADGASMILVPAWSADQCGKV